MSISIGKIKQRLSDLATQRSMPFDKLQTLFFLERAAFRLTDDSVLAKHLVFKGGFVSVRVYDSPRFPD